MKTILQFKKLFFIPLLFLLAGNVCLGQITYTGTPTSANGATCPTTNVTSGVSGTCTSATTFVGNTIEAYVGSINGTNATINLVKCDGTSFGTGTYYLKTNDICGTVLKYGSVSGSNVPISIGVSHTGTQNYRITFTSSNGARYYTNELRITGTVAQPNLSANDASIAPNPIVQNATPTTFQNTIYNTGNGSFTGKVFMNLEKSTGEHVGTIESVTVTIAANSSYTIKRPNIPIESAPGTYRVATGYLNSNGNFIRLNTKNNFVISAPAQPNLSANDASIAPNPIVQNATPTTFQNTIYNTGNGSFTGKVFMNLEKSTGEHVGTIESVTVTIAANSSYTIKRPNIPIESAPGTYRVATGYLNSNGNFIRLNTKNNFVISAPAQPNLSANNAIISPNPIVQNATPTTFQNTIYNTGNGSFTGIVFMNLEKSTGELVGTIESVTVTIAANSSYTIKRPNKPIETAPGNYRVATGYQNSNGSFSGLNTTNSFVITNTPSCITWTGTPPTLEKLTAANYLCAANIIQKTQNGNENKDFGVTRELLAKIAYLGIFKDKTLNSPAVNFPVPFTDMQGTTTQYMDAIKTLAYLQYDDETTPFDRDRANFDPKDLIQRKYVIKAFMEAFNIKKSTASPSPFSDVPTTHPMYGYIKRAHELGFITGNSVYTDVCKTGTCYHPDANITREDAFVILYRILNSTAITRPSSSDLGNKFNYHLPPNRNGGNSSTVPGIDHANFNHYQKTSFSIAGRGVSLDFTHTYNSFLTEMPKGFFEEGDEDTKQKFTPLGIGWTHTYNIYAQKIAGYTFESVTQPDKLMVYYPDGSINTFNYATGVAEGVGIYDDMTRTAISGGERITITTKGQIKYVLENYNNGKFYFIKSIKDRNNNGVKCTWQQILSGSRYRLVTVQEEFNNNSLGRSLTFKYPFIGSDKISQVTDNSINRTISFNVDATTKNLKTFTDAKNQQTIYSYDTSTLLGTNLLTQIQLPKGNKITNTYAQNKLKQSQTFSAANVATSTTAVNWVPEYASGQQYNSTATITDSQKRQTKYSHNTLGNPTKIESPTGTSTFDSYDAGNNANLPTSLTINGQQSSINYDAKGNIRNVTKNGITNAFTYTTKNDVETHTDGKGFTTTYSYDGVGNLKGVQRPSGYGATTIERNSFGQVETVTNPAGISTTFKYNKDGLTNLISIPLGISTSSTYDDASRLKSTTDANGKKNSFEYDENDNLKQSTDADSQIVKHTYDENDNHTIIENPKKEKQTNSYNWDDDSLKDETFGLHVKKYTYYEDGSLKTHTRGNGTFNYSYDTTTGRLQSDGETSYTYDAKGNIKTIVKVATSETLNLYYDPNDRLDYYTDYYGNKVDYSYDNNNNVTEIIYPGSKTVKYTYDAVNRCTDVTDWNTKNTHFDYETDDRIKKITLPNGTYTDYTYDDAGRPTGILNKKANGTIISSYGFTMDNAGNHKTETITEPSITAGLQSISNQTVTYGEAPFNQLKSQGSTTFTHNTAGGITQAGSNGYTYDLNDNMLTAPNSSFSYDGAGNRRAKTVNGVNTRYVLSILGMSQVLMETNSSNAVQNYYVYGPTGLLYRVKADNTTYSYYHYDYRGSTTAITNQAQTLTHSYSYDPFGKVLAKTEADANPFQYVGKYGVQYESPTLTFMRARYYDPTIGRFLSEDPIWALNLYPYADNNPVMGIDPKGEATTAPLLGIIDGLMEGAALDAYKAVVYSVLSVDLMLKGKYSEANTLSNMALRSSAMANFKILKGMALSVANDKLLSKSAILSKYQNAINSKIGTGILGKTGLLGKYGLDMRKWYGKLVKDYIIGLAGIDLTGRITDPLYKKLGLKK